MTGDYLVKHRQRYFARVQIPKDVRHLFDGKTEIRKTTGTRVLRDARPVAAKFVAEMLRSIEQARLALRPPLELRAEALVDQYQMLSGVAAERFALVEMVKHILKATGQSYADHVKALPSYDGYIFPPDSIQGQMLATMKGEKTAFLKHFEEWKAQVRVKGKTRQEYTLAIHQFVEAALHPPLQSVRGQDVQRWINGLLTAGDDEAYDTDTVNKKLSGIRNYWGYLTSLEIVDADHNPFKGRTVKAFDNPNKVKKLRYEADDVARLMAEADRLGNRDLFAMIKIAAYTGGRREGVAKLRANDIQTEPKTGIRFMHMEGKTEAGKRDVPIHSAIKGLIDSLIQRQDANGYLIHTNANNQYEMRGTILGKQFSDLKTKMGFGDAHDFHSLRRTVAHLFETAECPEGIAQDIIGHKKLGMTYGLYSGKTRIDHRAEWLERAIHYAMI